MKTNLLTRCMVLLATASLFYQCSDPHARYKDPPWLGGSNIETLEKTGKHNHFIALMDKAGYRNAIENQLFTLFVPNDSAFEVFFQSAGIASAEEMSKKQAEELFGQHILINPRSRDKLLYEYAWEELQDSKGEYGTLFHRKETYSIPLDYSEEVKYDPVFAGQTLDLYRNPTMIPLFTTEFFQDYFGDPDGSDYLFMYPESQWSGTQWHNAMVTEAEVRTATGLIYYIDRVVAPIPTIDKYLMEHQEKFGLFYDIAQRFASYYDPDFNEQLERRYRKGYSYILDIADEWGPNSGSDEARMLYMFTAFIPYDDVIQEYLDQTILQRYESIDSVPQLYLVYLLQSHLNSFLNLPSKMEQRFQNYYGDDIALDVNNDIGEAVMCSNGIIYGMNKFLEPNAFSCVPGPLFLDNNYSTFLYALQYSRLLTTLTQPDIDMTLFAADNDELLAYGIRQNDAEGNVYLEIQSSDGLWNEMLFKDIEDFVKDYIHVGKIEDFQGEGYLRMASDNYIYFNNNQVAGGGNQVLDETCAITDKTESEKNGNLFYMDNAIKAPYNAAELILTDPDLSSFAALLDQASLIDSVQADYEQPGVLYPRVIFLSELKQWTLLAPTNQAIADAEAGGLIPSDVEELKEFIYYHFVRNRCVFDDGVFSGTLPSHRIDTIIGSDIYFYPLEFNNSPGNLSIEDLSGQVISVDHDQANKLIETGVLHKIDAVLRLEP